MIHELVESRVQCPYCWERFTVLIDASVELQEYVEDCEVCCRPIDFVIEVDDRGAATIQARSQQE